MEKFLHPDRGCVFSSGKTSLMITIPKQIVKIMGIKSGMLCHIIESKDSNENGDKEILIVSLGWR